MSTSNASTKAYFTFIWIIENYTELTYIDLKSPDFVPQSLSKEKWYFMLRESIGLTCLLCSDDATMEEKSAMDFEFSLLAADGSALCSKRKDKKFLNKAELLRYAFLNRMSEFIPNNTLTVQCRLWREGHEISTSDIWYARTRLKTYTGTFIWPIEELSKLHCSSAEDFRQFALDERKVYSFKSFAEPYLKENSDDVHADNLIENGKGYAFGFELSVIGANGEVIESHEEGKRISSTCAVSYTYFFHLLAEHKLPESKNLFLSKDRLFLKCSFEVLTGVISSEIEYSTLSISSSLKEKGDVSDPAVWKEKRVKTRLDFYIEEQEKNHPLRSEEFFVTEENAVGLDKSYCISCPLKVTLRYLHSKEILSDTSLKCGTKLYPVHKNILASRSPVFERIFSKDMKDNIVEINDVAENILCLLLQYIYTDMVRDVQFENVVDLYKAAVNYELLDLKDKCSDFLILNFCTTNVQDVLFLAYQYEDEQLERSVNWRRRIPVL